MEEHVKGTQQVVGDKARPKSNSGSLGAGPSQQLQGGASSVEVYGFVGWITSGVAFGEMRAARHRATRIAIRIAIALQQHCFAYCTHW